MTHEDLFAFLRAMHHRTDDELVTQGEMLEWEAAPLPPGAAERGRLVRAAVADAVEPVRAAGAEGLARARAAVQSGLAHANAATAPYKGAMAAGLGHLEETLGGQTATDLFAEAYRDAPLSAQEATQSKALVRGLHAATVAELILPEDAGDMLETFMLTLEASRTPCPIEKEAPESMEELE